MRYRFIVTHKSLQNDPHALKASEEATQAAREARIASAQAKAHVKVLKFAAREAQRTWAEELPGAKVGPLVDHEKQTEIRGDSVAFQSTLTYAGTVFALEGSEYASTCSLKTDFRCNLMIDDQLVVSVYHERRGRIFSKAVRVSYEDINCRKINRAQFLDAITQAVDKDADNHVDKDLEQKVENAEQKARTLADGGRSRNSFLAS